MPGPTLGTIHSSKGRESECVYLVLPNKPGKHADTSWKIAEEMRILFVGATRARNQLNTARRGSWSKASGKLNRSGRSFKYQGKNKNAVQAEIGLMDDIDVSSTASSLRFDCKEDAADYQDHLWNQTLGIMNGEVSPAFVAKYDFDKKRNILFEEDDNEAAWMSEQFGHDLFNLGKALGLGYPVNPGPTIRHIRMTGTRTAIVNKTERTGLHTPYMESGFVLAPIISAFTMVYFNKRR
jgi:hypothetical protein